MQTELEQIYRRYAGELLRFALYLTRDRDRAEDLVAETFCRCLTSAEPLRGETVKSYLFAIARNLFLEQLRKRGREAPLDGSWPARGDLARDMEARDRLADTLAAMADLTEQERTALWMQAAHGLRYEEIAQALHLSLAAVKARIFRARWKLASRMAGEEPK